jgi:hydrophobic/amphiphilic exporter-1 (mainly G- bacteria), HAE1 family
MNLPAFSIRRPVTVLMASLIAILLGTISFLRLPIDLMPEIVYPTISVRAEYPGVAPEEMENLVARPLEEALSSAPGVKEISSSSSEGMANVRVSFEHGVNLDEAANELRSRLDRRRGTLPEDMLPPVMFKFDVSQFPIMFLTVASPDMDARELRTFVEKQIQYRLERVPGVAQFMVRGGLRREIHVNLDVAKLRSLNISVSDVVNVIRRENQNRPVGPVHEGNYQVLLRSQGEFRSVDEIQNVVVATRNGVPVTIREVATVEDAHEDILQKVSVDGEAAVRLFVYKQSGANTVTVSDGVWREIERIHRDYPNVRISSTSDTADFIRSAIANVKNAAIIGAVLAVVVLLIFLRSISSTMIIGVAIPISVISTFTLIYFYGFTLNTISFGGLALGVGMLVDNAIVVLENIFRHREGGESQKDAANKGSREVAGAITASTLTTLAVFVPLVFIAGLSAVTFQQLAYVVSFALICSLLVALTVVPVLCSRFLRSGQSSRKAPGILGRIADGAEAVQQRLNVEYRGVIGWAIGHRKVVAAGALAAFGIAFLLAPLIGVELSPEADEGEVRVNVQLEPGTRVEVTDAIMQRLALIAKEKTPEAQSIMVEAGSGGGWNAGGQHLGELRIQLLPRTARERSARDVAMDLRPAMMIEPGMIVRTRVSTGMFGRMMGSSGGDRVVVEIRGHDLEVMDDLARQVRDIMASIPGVPEAQVNREPGTPEMLLSVDRVKAASLGLNVSDVAEAMETAIGGTRTSMYREQGDEFNILVRLKERNRLNVAQIGQVPLVTVGGQTIPAEAVLQTRRQEGPVQIERLDQQRIVTVSGTLGDRDLGGVMSDLDERLQTVNRPAGYEFRYGGEYQEQQEAFRELTIAAILALMLVYMVMAAQFESLRDPFIILFSIPLAAVGVTMALVLTHTTFNMQAFLGLIMLVGIVVNNAIILVDYMNQLRRDHGYSIRDAVLEGGSRRLRPVLMTTTTTVLGLLPMALGIGEGSELQAPMARVVIGGLLSSTLITLVLIPVIYLTVEQWGEKRATRDQEVGGGEQVPQLQAGD